MPDPAAVFLAEPLNTRHLTQNFDCGDAGLNEFLRRHALNAAAAGSARSFVVAGPEDYGTQPVLGFYSLVAGHVEHIAAGERATKGMPKFPIPAVMLARLAVDRTQQGKNLGTTLLKDATRRTLAAAELVGVRMLVVDAKSPPLAKWYEDRGFTPSPQDPLRLMAILKDLRQPRA